MQEYTIKAKLLAKEKDFQDYVIYVFQNLDDASFGHKYVMMTRWPNWQTRVVDIGEVGFVTYQEVQEGIDSWWDGSKFIPYNCTNLVFRRFVLEKTPDNSKNIIL